MFSLTRRDLLCLAGVPAAVTLFPAAGAPLQRITQAGFIRIGGIDQWVSIRGRDVDNPAILFVHGGPGQAESLFPDDFVLWESDFTVVSWDQRGSGNTYGKNGPSTPDMTMDRMAQDAIEVAEYARKRLSKQRVILVGHSWGSALGLATVSRRPGIFHAFVGTAQLVNWKRTIEARELWARQRAAAVADALAMKRLDEVATLPLSDPRRLNATNNWVMSPSDEAFVDGRMKFIESPPSQNKDEVKDWKSGQAFSGEKLFPILVTFDARKVVMTLPIPFFVVQGRDDHMVSFEEAKAYAGEMRAPVKAFVPMDGGHFACFTQPREFLSILNKHVRPLTHPDRR